MDLRKMQIVSTGRSRCRKREANALPAESVCEQATCGSSSGSARSLRHEARKERVGRRTDDWTDARSDHGSARVCER